MKRLMFAILVLTELLNIEAFASEIKIRDTFISNIPCENLGYEVVLSHSNTNSYADPGDLYKEDQLFADGLEENGKFVAQRGEWKQNTNGWWYENNDGTYPHNAWAQIEGYWYLFDANGYMQIGWKQMDKKWYYLYSDGRMATNTWVGNYYVGEDGAMLMKTTTPDGYFVGSDGKWIQNNISYTEYIDVLENSEAERFALCDLNEDGIVELFLELPDRPRFSSKLSVFELEGGKAVQRLNAVDGGNVAVRKGQPYIAVHKTHTELWLSYLYDGADSYKLIMESVKGGETYDPLPDWGEKDRYVQIVRNAQLLNFVTNDSVNRDKYVISGVETGYAGTPNLENSYMGWLWEMY